MHVLITSLKMVRIEQEVVLSVWSTMKTQDENTARAFCPPLLCSYYYSGTSNEFGLEATKQEEQHEVAGKRLAWPPTQR